ncbi:MAG: hypothetical protein AABW83_00810 [Nanoarchaeota archaeon]
MLIEQLAEYVVKNLKKGYTLDSLRFSLISQGYSRISIEKAIETANKIMANEIPRIKEKPEILYKVLDEPKSIISKIKDFFTNLFK